MNPLVQRLMDRAAGEVLEIVRFLGGVIAVWLVMMTFIYAAFHIPSGSMQPTLEVGDRVLVSKWAYGYSRHSLPLGIGYLLPSSWNGRLAWADPQRGDVVVFRDERQADGRPRNLIKRVMGVAGDRVEMGWLPRLAGGRAARGRSGPDPPREAGAGPGGGGLGPGEAAGGGAGGRVCTAC